MKSQAGFFVTVTINYARKTHLHVRLNYANKIDQSWQFSGSSRLKTPIRNILLKVTLTFDYCWSGLFLSEINGRCVPSVCSSYRVSKRPVRLDGGQITQIDSNIRLVDFPEGFNEPFTNICLVSKKRAFREKYTPFVSKSQD